MSKPFDELTPAEKRVAIANDALAQLAAQKFVATPGTYCEISTIPKRHGEELRNLLPESSPCEVCAVGSLFLASVILADRFTVDERDFDDWETYELEGGRLFAHLGQWFGSEQLSLVEQAFEGDDVQGDGEVDAALAYYDEFEEHDRLVAILRNIVRNGGEFIPNVEADAVAAVAAGVSQ